MNARRILALTFVAALLAVGLWKVTWRSKLPGANVVALPLSSGSFALGADIPKKFTCDGDDVSPQLSWFAPAGIQSFALIAEDPDAPIGTFTHWVIFDLPATATALPEGVSKVAQLPDGSRQGENDFDKIGYSGPCPPPGMAHRYFFKLYVLDRKLGLRAGSSKREVEKAMDGHILARTEYFGKYKR